MAWNPAWTPARVQARMCAAIAVDVEVGIARRIRLVCIGFEQPRGMRTERAVDEEIPAESVCSGFVEERASILFAVYNAHPSSPEPPRRDRGPTVPGNRSIPRCPVPRTRERPRFRVRRRDRAQRYEQKRAEFPSADSERHCAPGGVRRTSTGLRPSIQRCRRGRRSRRAMRSSTRPSERRSARDTPCGQVRPRRDLRSTAGSARPTRCRPNRVPR